MYVKNMPIDDILPLDEDVIKKIKKNVYNTKALRERNEDVSQLLSEVTQNYVCIMNELVFIESLHRQETPAQEYLIEFAEPLPLDIPKPRVPRYRKSFSNKVTIKLIETQVVNIIGDLMNISNPFLSKETNSSWTPAKFTVKRFRFETRRIYNEPVLD